LGIRRVCGNRDTGVGFSSPLSLSLSDECETKGTKRGSGAPGAMSGGIARGRLAEERKAWRKNHPHVCMNDRVLFFALSTSCRTFSLLLLEPHLSVGFCMRQNGGSLAFLFSVCLSVCLVVCCASCLMIVKYKK
jgi:hypothetical protein